MNIFKRLIILMILIIIPTISYSKKKILKSKIVKIKEVLVEHSFTELEVKETIARDLAAIRNCYYMGLNKNPNLKGRLTIKWIINSSGRVPYAKILKSDLNNKKVEHCIHYRILRLHFKTKNTLGLNSVTRVKYQFIFAYH